LGSRLNALRQGDQGSEADSLRKRHAYYLGLVIPNVDPHGFPAGKAVTGCTDTAVSFAR
jgi:hypothetical protein